MATVVFGLLAAVTWGAADFGGGLASRRTPVFGVVLLSQGAGLVVAIGLVVLTRQALPAGRDLALCLIAGVVGGIGVSALYQALSVGRMGIVAPVTGVLAAVIPVGAGIVLQGLPAPIVLGGIVLAIVAVVLVSRVADEGGGRSGIREAVLAGIAIGIFGVVIAQIEAEPFGALTVIRTTQAVLVVGVILATRASWKPNPRLVPAIVAVGLLDAAGNTCYLLAVQSGALAVASVLSALYPVGTVILAAAVLRERVTRDHAIGIALAGVAVAMIGGGST